jgi:endonuclease/exonuclease/phosphatase family metal-dependent hydrolase
MAYRKKQQSISLMRPDIAVIQEVSRRDLDASPATFAHWVGTSPSKGLGVLCFGEVDCSISPDYKDDIPWFIPLIVDDVHVLAIWACVASNSRRYVRLIHEALDHYADFLAVPRSVIIGDFNSNSNFDRKHQKLSHSFLVERLAEMGLTSVYHRQLNEAHGAESQPTFFMYRNIEKPYHFDYAFVSSALLERSRLALGTPEHFRSMSDHLPLILDF